MKRAQIFSVGLLLLLFAVAVAVGCANQPAAPLQGDMRSAYREARTLYGYVWTPSEFIAPHSEKAISSSLERLAGDFHNAEVDAPLSAFEPGFRVALAAQKNLLLDASARFKQGQKEYVRWRLSGMAANCIACHSRFQAPINFIGDLPQAEDDSPETLLLQSQFLFATRQFDKASETLFGIAKQFSNSEAGWRYQFDALKLWLVIEVRTKNRPAESAKHLEEYLQTSHVPATYKSTMENWVSDFRALAAASGAPADFIAEAKRLIAPLAMDATIFDDERHLVTTLRATSLLHEVLQNSPSVDQRRQGTYLLGRAYFHIPLAIFEPFQDQYLEMTIREFPHTREAQFALRLYEYQLQNGLGVSGGDYLPEQTKQLIELRKLASPESGSDDIASDASEGS